MNAAFSMRKNEFLLDKFSQPQNHPLLVAKQVHEAINEEIHLNDLIKPVLRKRKQKDNLAYVARVLIAVGNLVALGRLRYYRGHLSKI
jgi:hypothetical protein